MPYKSHNRSLQSCARAAFVVSIVATGLLLPGCGGSDYAATPASTVTPPATAPPAATPEFVYVANGDSDDVSAFKINANSGALVPVAGSPFREGLESAINENVPGTLAAHPSGNFLYVANADIHSLSVWGVDRVTGALTTVTGSPVQGGVPSWLEAHPSGKFLYAASFDGGAISAWSIDSASGLPAQIAGSPFALGHALVLSVALHPSGTLGYVTIAEEDGGGGLRMKIRAFAIDPQTGAITLTQHENTDQAGVLTMHPSGKFLYSSISNSLLDVTRGIVGTHALAIDAASGALTPIGSPFPMAAFDAAIDPAGRLLYAVDDTGGRVGHFTIDANTGALTHSSDASAGGQPFAAAVNATGKFLYVVNRGSNNVSAYAIGAGGALTNVPGSPFSTGTRPVAIAVIRAAAQ